MRGAAASICLLLCICVRPASGQTLFGRIVEAGSERVVSRAFVALFDTAGGIHHLVTADTGGNFHLHATAGIYRLRVERLGYATLETAPFALSITDSLRLHVPLIATALPLDPLLVTARQNRIRADFEARRAARPGDYFVTPDDIDRTSFSSLASLVARAGWIRANDDGRAVVIRRRGQICKPILFVDGVRIPDGPAAAEGALIGPVAGVGSGDAPRSDVGLDIDAHVSPSEVRAIEIYSDVLTAPPAFEPGAFTNCGVIVVWTDLSFGG